VRAGTRLGPGIRTDIRGARTSVAPERGRKKIVPGRESWVRRPTYPSSKPPQGGDRDSKSRCICRPLAGAQEFHFMLRRSPRAAPWAMLFRPFRGLPTSVNRSRLQAPRPIPMGEVRCGRLCPVSTKCPVPLVLSETLDRLSWLRVTNSAGQIPIETNGTSLRKPRPW
jgi:hypothetical protein